MGDVVFFKEYIIFDREEDIQGIKDGSIKKVDSMGREEQGVDMTRMKRGCGSRLGGRYNSRGQEGHFDKEDG